MRKDMRLGFGVGGVLLAVIIVAILVIHRNQGKTVAFEKNGAATSETSTIDANNVQPGLPTTGGADDSTNLKPADPLPSAPKAADPKTQLEPRPASVADDSVKTDATQWDRLFASSSDSPKSQLRHPSSSQPRVSDAQPSESSAAVADVAPKHDADNAIAASDKVPASKKGTHSSASDSTGSREHVVKSGESFYTIAKAAYGDTKHTKDLMSANPSIDASKLRPGMTVKIPALSSIAKPASDTKTAKPSRSSAISLSARETTTTVSDNKTTYTVKSGDSLYKIGRDLYGNGTKGDDIYVLNRDVIGNDSTKLKVGQVLKLPSDPTASAR